MNLDAAGITSNSPSGLDYFIARHYSQTIGRFLQPDEFAGGPVDAFSSNDPLPPGPLPYADITNPQSLNKYAYTYNNPLTYVDPDGHGVLDFAFGVVNSVANNLTLGVVPRAESSRLDVRAGQAVGDAASFVGGVVGAGAAAAGAIALDVGTGGAALVATPAQAAVIAYPAAVAGVALVNFAKSVPNPFGSAGKPDHAQTSAEEAEKIGGQREVTVKTPGGEKSSRRVDAARTEGGKVREAVQVYRPTKTGKVPAREVRAADDIQKATRVKPRLVPVRPKKQ